MLTNGTGSLIKDGTHAMALRGNNSGYGGTIAFNASSPNAGTLSVGAAPNRLPVSTALAVPSGALFQLDANNQTVSDFSGLGSVNLGGGILTIAQNGTNTFSGVIQNSELAGSSTALGNGLRGYYYTNIDFTGLGTVRDDAGVNLPAMTALPGYSSTAKTNQISVRWLGQVLTTVGGTYTFTTKTDDGTRLWVNGTLLVDDWTTQGATAKSGNIALAASTKYDLVMEYFNNAAGGSATLSWTPPGGSSVILPSTNLFLPGPGSLVMSGTGTQQLSGASTYSGGTTVSNGTLEATADGALGSGNVTVADGATLKLDSSAAMNPSANLLLNPGAPHMVLSYFGTNTIHAISLDGGATYGPAGTYGSGANNPNGVFTGSGYLNVTAGPATNAILSITANGGNSFTLNLIGSYQAQYYVLSQTNVAEPMANWLPVPGSTNTVTNLGGLWSVTVTNPAPAYYRAKAMSVFP